MTSATLPATHRFRAIVVLEPMAKLGRPPGAYTQYRRLTELRDVLENHPKGLSLIELATRLKVTERSVRRYLKEMQRQVDLEKQADPTGLGGIVVKIPTRDLPRRVKLHRAQVYGVLMARRVFSLLDGTDFELGLRQAVTQLYAHVQRSPRRGAVVDPDTRLEERFVYLPRPPARRQHVDHVDRLLDACAQLRVCRVRHDAHESDGVDTRAQKTKPSRGEWLTIHPYAVVLHHGEVFTIAWIRELESVRTLRVDRLVEVEAATLEQFPLPDDFEVDPTFAAPFGVHVEASVERVVIDLDRGVIERALAERIRSVDGREASFEPLPDGGARVTFDVSITPELRRWILSLGSAAKVVAPTSLATSIARELAAACARYADARESAATIDAPAHVRATKSKLKSVSRS